MARFIGGPLNGQTYPAGEASAVAAAFNQTYAPDRYVRDAQGNYDYSVGGSTPGSQLTVGPSAHKAWGDLRHAVNRSLPTALHRSQAYRQAAWRRLHRHFGVR